VFNDLPGTITAIATLLLALSATILTWRNALRAERVERLAQEANRLAAAAAAAAAKAAETAKATHALMEENSEKLAETGKAIDGRLSQLLETTNKLSHAEGKEEGRAEEKEKTLDGKGGP
jgi:hypothetical protein